jgi:hypothetical protein
MIDRTDISEAMIAAAMKAAPAQLTREEVRRILSVGLAKMVIGERGAAYPLWVSTSIEVKRARFIGTTERRAYFRVETEDGKDLIVHANDFQPNER